MIRTQKFSLLFALLLLLPQTSFASIATYRLTVHNDWTEALHPANYPSNSHFSSLGGGSHHPSQSFWELGGFANAAFELMAETGNTPDFVEEVMQAGGSPLQWRQWFCQPSNMMGICGGNQLEFDIDSDQSAVTLVSMLGPSPDWFVGVSALDLQPGGAWIQQLNEPLALYDAGTEDGNTPEMFVYGPTSPQAPISLIAYDAQSGQYVPSSDAYFVGSFEFELLSVTPVPLPASFILFIPGLVALLRTRRGTLAA